VQVLLPAFHIHSVLIIDLQAGCPEVSLISSCILPDSLFEVKFCEFEVLGTKKYKLRIKQIGIV
jgi:hypothetical protein